jgi:hypothetical protein
MKSALSKVSIWSEEIVGSRVARFFVKLTKTGKNIPNDHKLYQTATKFTTWLKNRPDGHNIFQHFLSQNKPKFEFFGMQICIQSGNPGF